MNKVKDIQNDGLDHLRWELGDTHVAVQLPFHTIEMTPSRNPRTGAEGDFYRFACPDWVNVLALTPEKELVMIRQFRHGTRTVENEVPAGLIDPGEAPIEAAARELLEEAAYRPKDAGRILSVVYPNPALQNNRCFYVLFENVEKVEHDQQEELEHIESYTLPLAQAIEMVRQGKEMHALVVLGILLLDTDEFRNS